MQIKIRNELLLLNILVIVLILAIIFFPSNFLRIVLGVPFLLFLPGYTLMAAIFPRRNGMDVIERTALSFGASVAIVPMIGLLLNYTALGVRLEPVLYSVSLFILVASIIAWLRRRRLPEQERFIVSFSLSVPGWGGSGDLGYEVTEDNMRKVWLGVLDDLSDTLSIIVHARL